MPLRSAPSGSSPTPILQWLGPWALVGLALIVFAECGLLIGFFLPGDSLLFTAGLFVADGAIGPRCGWCARCWCSPRCSATRAATGSGAARAQPCSTGRGHGCSSPEHVVKTQEFFDRYGNRAIVLGRFVPIVRTFITVMAGVGRMAPRRYLTYSVIGGVAWAAGVTVLGYWLGQFAFVKANIEFMIIAIVIAVDPADGRRDRPRAAPGGRRRTRSERRVEVRPATLGTRGRRHGDDPRRWRSSATPGP